MLRPLVFLLALTACGPELAPPPTNAKGECPPRPECVTDTVCELDARRGCEVCTCRASDVVKSPPPK